MNIYKAESKYIKNNSMVKIFQVISGFVGAFVIIAMSSYYSGKLDIVRFIREQYMGFIILAFILPFQYSNYFCSNFETGSIKNIIASGNSRKSFVIAKFLKQASNVVKCVTWYSIGSIIMFALKFIFLQNNVTLVNFSFYFIFEMFLKYLMICVLIIYFSTLILFISMTLKKEMISSLATLFILVANIVTTLRLSQSDDYTLIKTNLYFYKTIMIMENYHFADQTFISGIQNFLAALIVPMISIIIFLTLSIVMFQKNDITI